MRFVMCGCFGNTCTCIYCVLYGFYCIYCVVSFMYIYSYLFGLYLCKDYCHRVTTQLQLLVVVVVVVVVVIKDPYSCHIFNENRNYSTDF